MITIVDYGLGNVGSVANMLKKVTAEPLAISGRPEQIETADKLILPGVGHFDRGMKNLEKAGLIPILNRRVLVDRVPILGICLGMQLMARGSEEAETPGLGWIDAEFKRFRLSRASTRKVPHMGWNWVRFVNDSPIARNVPANSRFYFVHSYHCANESPADALAVCNYEYDFTAAFQRDNIFGVQFHPEKSHRFGSELLRGFACL
jgi:glutamine amidotransferase